MKMGTLMKASGAKHGQANLISMYDHPTRNAEMNDSPTDNVQTSATSNGKANIISLDDIPTHNQGPSNLFNIQMTATSNVEANTTTMDKDATHNQWPSSQLNIQKPKIEMFSSIKIRYRLSLTRIISKIFYFGLESMTYSRKIIHTYNGYFLTEFQESINMLLS